MSARENIAIPCDVIPPEARWADGREHEDDGGEVPPVTPEACAAAACISAEEAVRAALRHPT